MKRQYVQWYASATQCEPYNVEKSIFITKMLWNDTGKLDLNHDLCIKVFFLHMTARSRDSPSFHLLINKDSYFHEASALRDRTNTVTGSVQKGRSSKIVERPRAVLEVRKLWKISIHKSKVGLKVSTRLLKACEVYFICGHWAQMGKRILF